MRTAIAILVLATFLLVGRSRADAQLISQHCSAQYYFPLRAVTIVSDYAANEKRLVCRYTRIPRWMMPFGDADLFCRQANPWPLLRSQRTAKMTRCVYWYGQPG